MKQIEIDAKNIAVGRTATKAAMSLMGKDSPDYKANKAAEVQVVIQNAAQAKVTLQRKTGKVYTRYTGYPGGLREERMDKLIEKKGMQEVFKKAVYGMLPNNRLRKIRMKNLVINE